MVPSSLTADSVSTVSKAAFLSEKREHVLRHPDPMQVLYSFWYRTIIEPFCVRVLQNVPRRM